MATSKQKGLDEQVLEGGGAGGGFGGGRQSATAKKVQSMTPQERSALLENVGKQFEMSASDKAAMTERIRKAKESMDPKARAELENIGEQFRKKKGGAVSASKRADGIAQRGKTRGKVL